jgi:hypothetical protein
VGYWCPKYNEGERQAWRAIDYMLRRGRKWVDAGAEWPQKRALAPSPVYLATQVPLHGMKRCRGQGVLTEQTGAGQLHYLPVEAHGRKETAL